MFSDIEDYRRDDYWPVCGEPANVDLVGLSFAISPTTQHKKSGFFRPASSIFFLEVSRF